MFRVELVIRRNHPRLREIVEAAVGRASVSVGTEMQNLVSGGVSSAQLAEEGHPFARNPAPRGGRGRQRGTRARLPINVQTGALRESLHHEALRPGGEVAHVWRFRAEHAKFVLRPGGTRPMVARGYYSEVKQRGLLLLRRAAREIRQALRRR